VPTPENIAYYLYQEIKKQMPFPSLKLKMVRLYEGDDLWVDYQE